MNLFCFLAEIETVLRFECFCYERVYSLIAFSCFFLQNRFTALMYAIIDSFVIQSFVFFVCHSITA